MRKDLKEVRKYPCRYLGEEHSWQRQHLKGLKVRTYLSYKRDSKEASVAGVEYLRGRVVGREVREIKRGWGQGVRAGKTF